MATITLTSDAAPGTYLYLFAGAVLYENDDIDTSAHNYGSRISECLPAGIYTIVATTFQTQRTGDFILDISLSR